MPYQYLLAYDGVPIVNSIHKLMNCWQSEDDSEEEEEDVAMEAEEEEVSEDGSDVETEEPEDYDTVCV